MGEESACELRVKAMKAIQNIVVRRNKFVAWEALQDGHGQAGFAAVHAVAHECDSQCLTTARLV